MTRTFEGPAAGLGARMARASSEVGNGTQETVAIEADTRVENRLVFDGTAPSTAVFPPEPAGAATMVCRALKSGTGTNPVSRRLGVLVLDHRVCGDFARGLASLKARAEGG